MKGRIPIPAHLKVLEGNCGKRPIPKPVVQSKSGAITCPDYLGKRARQEWQRIYPELKETIHIGKLDRSLLAAYCILWETVAEADAKIQKTSLVLKSGTGYFYQNPYVSIRNNAIKQMESLASHLGLSPSARSRINTAPDTPDSDDDILD